MLKDVDCKRMEYFHKIKVIPRTHKKENISFFQYFIYISVFSFFIRVNKCIHVVLSSYKKNAF